MIEQVGHVEQGVAERIAKLSEASELLPGGLICSGTPDIVGPVPTCDVIVRKIRGLADLSIRIV